ncbi:malate synthase [Bacillus coahuilensis p1.1.43]|uniref:Malate synthase n=1 Tax=Bacillus coahuilensis p1.1.43 TaxID=1150625 RepID=A0A147KCA1_9BACI|nr:malate synthase A [Bacillus coahuilensis]KUP09241.1 malate synthase [Bacillus coahuilensis p1.1.43]
MTTQTAGILVKGRINEGFSHILTPEALHFLEQLERRFGTRRKDLLQEREEKQEFINNGGEFSFLSETEHIRRCDWEIAPLPKDLADRRVEITGPVDRKMVINALNSGAKSFMACFEDATSPTWSNVIEGQMNMRDAVNGTISYENQNGKQYRLNDKTAVLVVRPRGFHLEEKHILLDGEPLSASIVDFGLYFFHNAQKLVQKGTGPYFYIAKLESYLEARLWNDMFVYAQKYVGIPRGTIKATVLIETLPAVFEMDEILFELREHSAGLNCGRWDYIFSYIKKLREKEDVVLPDRSLVSMTVPFMDAYTKLTIKTCHRRKAPAMGGMAAQIPVKGDTARNEEAFAKVRADKEREAKNGHDGTWVAHPALVPVAMEVFNQEMPGENQIDSGKQLDFVTTAEQLVEVPAGDITEAGVRQNINVGIQYISSWLSGRGAAPIHHLMEDAATAEISRAQLWQWIRHPKGVLNDGRDVTVELYEALKEEEVEKIKVELGQELFTKTRVDEAVKLFDTLILNDEFENFLTIPGYELI